MQMGKIADISKYQGRPDFEKLKRDVDMLIIRVQFGSRVEDSVHKYDESMAKHYGIPFGEYAFGNFVSISDAIKEANDFLKRIDKEAKFLVLDVESPTLKSCGTKDLQEATQAFIDVCKKAGYKTGLYVSHYMYRSYGLDKVKCDFLWLPYYGVNNGMPNNPPHYPCDLWQYTSKGHVDGINGYVDLSQLSGNKNLDWFIGGNENKPNPSQPVQDSYEIPKPTQPQKEMDYMAQFNEMFDQAIQELRQKPVSNWAEVQWKEACDNGYFDGAAPQGFITRQEDAAVINRLRHNIKGLFADMDKRIKALEEKVK